MRRLAVTEFFDYNERVKQFKRNDFWRQVRRTINGNPVDPQQIDLIITQISKYLRLSQKDVLVDLGCGNGALSNLLQSKCSKLYGIDRSQYLIDVANEYFACDSASFEIGDIRALDVDLLISNRVNKVLMYGVSSFMNDDELATCIRDLSRLEEFSMFIGNVRDIDCAHSFFKEEVDMRTLLDTSSSMGMWRCRQWFFELSSQLGLSCSIHKMPYEFYAQEYYYDVLISRV